MDRSLNGIDSSAQPLDLSFHPKQDDILAVSLVDGTLEVHNLSHQDSSDPESDTIISSIDIHSSSPTSIGKKASCRTVLFAHDGDKILTGGAGGDLCMLDSERSCQLGASEETCVLWRIPNDGHAGSAVHCLHQLPPVAPCGPLWVSGDEDGAIRLWDERMCGSGTSRSAVSFYQGTDYISAFDHEPQDSTTLLATSADCTLSAIDLRKAMNPQTRRESCRRSDDQEDELLSIKVLKHGKKVVCGSQQGVLAVWSWGTWGDVSDRFPGHPASIDAMVKVDEDTVLTGSSDGLIRLVQIHPDKLLGILGDHDGYPIEKLEFNASRAVLGSVSHDNIVRLWDAQILQDDEDEADDKESAGHNPTTQPRGLAKTPQVMNDSDDEWTDDDEDDDDLAESDLDEDMEEETQNQRRAKRLKSDNEKFFEDL